MKLFWGVENSNAAKHFIYSVRICQVFATQFCRLVNEKGKTCQFRYSGKPIEKKSNGKTSAHINWCSFGKRGVIALCGKTTDTARFGAMTAGKMDTIFRKNITRAPFPNWIASNYYHRMILYVCIKSQSAIGIRQIERVSAFIREPLSGHEISHTLLYQLLLDYSRPKKNADLMIFAEQTHTQMYIIYYVCLSHGHRSWFVRWIKYRICADSFMLLCRIQRLKQAHMHAHTSTAVRRKKKINRTHTFLLIGDRELCRVMNC